jgi:drug/metabolite transporter (DMT)-like permease
MEDIIAKVSVIRQRPLVSPGEAVTVYYALRWKKILEKFGVTLIELNPKTRGLIWVTLAGLLFVGFVAIVRFIGDHLHPLETAFIRYALGLAILTPMFIRYGMRLLYSHYIFRHALRGAVHGIGVMLWFYAVTLIPIAEVTALSFISPIFVAIGASLFLGERLSARRIIVITLGIVGVLIILRPGVEVVSFGAIAMLVAAPLFATSKLLTKALVKHDSASTIVAYLSIFATLTMAVPAMLVWQTPTLEELVWLLATALFATLSHLCMARGLALVDVTVAQPVEFLQLVWSTLLGIVVFGEQPSIWIWVGAGVIVVSATYIMRYEARPS